MGREFEIRELLSEIKKILERHKVIFWSSHFAELESWFDAAYQSDDIHEKHLALDAIKQVYGGMGSFGDVYINAIAGDSISPEEESYVNKNLRFLRSALYEAVTDEILKTQG